jgi:Coenzyme PQQ synthesis protein D (PqqD)
MKRSIGRDLPKAREKDLVTRQIPGELLVYDLKRHKAFCLNDTAAVIWKGCNGKRDVNDLARLLADGRKSPVDERVVWLALDQLEKSNLLRQKVSRPVGLTGVSRRDLIRMGVVAAITLPLITTITAPTAAQAGTPITDAVCTGRHQSDPGGCGNNPCLAPAVGKCINGPGNTCKCG